MSGEVAELEREADVLPDGWRAHRLGDVATLSGGTTPSRAEPAYWENATIPWATPSDITSLAAGVSRIADTEAKVSDRALAECSLTLNPPGTVLMTSRATIGFVAVNDVPMATNQGFITFRAGERLDAGFLLYWLTAQRGNLVAAAGGSTFKELSRGTAKLLPILLPPLDEQRRIAEVLRSVDEAIAVGQKVAEQAQALWNGLTECLIWDRLSTRPDEAQPLGNALRGSDYGVNAPLGSEPAAYAVLRMGNLQDGWIDPTDLKWGEIADAEAQALALDVGDILFNRTNSRDLVGKVALVREPTDFLYASYIVRLRVNQSVADPYYLFAVMHSRRAQAQFKSIATPGVSQSNINPTNLKKQTVPIPSLAEQREIAVQLQSAEAARRTAMHELVTLRQIKADLMSDLLSGRVRVPA